MSIVPSSFDSTDRSWTPRFCATAATPAVRQLASPTRTYSTGVAPKSDTGSVLLAVQPERFMRIALWPSGSA